MEMEKMPVGKLLLKLSPPVMLALLIQSIYNIVDSFFIGRYAAEGLTALSVIYPLQLLITSVATGTGAGIGILVSRLDGEGKEAGVFIRNGLLTGVLNYILFAAAGMLVLRPYFAVSSDNPLVREMGVSYGGIVILLLGRLLHRVQLLEDFAGPGEHPPADGGAGFGGAISTSSSTRS